MSYEIRGYDSWKLMSPDQDAHFRGVNCGEWDCCGNGPMPEPECPHCDQLPCTGKNILINHDTNHAYECNCTDVFEPECATDPPFNVIFHEDRECDCGATPIDTFLMPNNKTFTRSSSYHVSVGNYYVCNCGHSDTCGDTDWEEHRCIVPIKPNPDLVYNDDDDIPF